MITELAPGLYLDPIHVFAVEVRPWTTEGDNRNKVVVSWGDQKKPNINMIDCNSHEDALALGSKIAGLAREAQAELKAVINELKDSLKDSLKPTVRPFSMTSPLGY